MSNIRTNLNTPRNVTNNTRRITNQNMCSSRRTQSTQRINTKPTNLCVTKPKTTNVKPQINKNNIDIDRIAISAENAKKGEFIKSNKLNKEIFLESKNVTYKNYDNDSILISNEGVPIGFTDLKGIKKDLNVQNNWCNSKNTTTQNNWCNSKNTTTQNNWCNSKNTTTQNNWCNSKNTTTQNNWCNSKNTTTQNNWCNSKNTTTQNNWCNSKNTTTQNNWCNSKDTTTQNNWCNSKNTTTQNNWCNSKNTTTQNNWCNSKNTTTQNNWCNSKDTTTQNNWCNSKNTTTQNNWCNSKDTTTQNNWCNSKDTTTQNNWKNANTTTSSSNWCNSNNTTTQNNWHFENDDYMNSKAYAILKGLNIAGLNAAFKPSGNISVTDLCTSKRVSYGNYINIYDNGRVTYNVDGAEHNLSILSNDIISRDLNISDIVSIKKNGNAVDVITKKGNTLHLLNNESVIVNTDKDGNILYGYTMNPDGELSDISIFNDYMNSNYQYGGRQATFRQNVDEYLNDPIIYNELEKSFPGSTWNEKRAYLSNMSGRCCGYVAEINSLYKNYQGRESEFRDKFGFDMYKVDNNGNIDYNYEYMVLKYYDYVYSTTGQKNINEICNMNTGYNTPEGYKFADFITNDYGINCNVQQYINTDLGDIGIEQATVMGPNDTVADVNISNIYSREQTLTAYRDLVSQGHDDIMIGAYKYRLIDCENGSLFTSPTTAHAMTVLGEENNNLIVSSFGRKYILDLGYTESIEGYNNFYTTDYE